MLDSFYADTQMFWDKVNEFISHFDTQPLNCLEILIINYNPH